MSLRARRVADEIHRVVGSCFQGGNLSDPRLDQVTVTHVKVTRDLQLASIYFRVYDQQCVESALSGLVHCRGYLRLQIGQQMRVRRVPELRFFHDASVEVGARIEDLLARADTDLLDEE